MLSTNSTQSEILDWLNSQSTELFTDFNLDSVQYFAWEVNRRREGERDRWAGLYRRSSIYLDPNFFRGIQDEKKQSIAIQDILLHELCHHVQDQIAPSSPSHGREFRELAYYVNGKLKRDAVTIYHSLAKTPEGEEAIRAQRKALALLARTTSSNEHEAMLAAAKYAEFVAANNISLDSHAETLSSGLPLMVKEHIWTAKNMSHWLKILLPGVAYVNACSWTWIRCEGCTKIHFYGKPHKICQAFDMIDYLTEAIDRVVKKAQLQSDESRGKSYWSSFREGVAQRVTRSLMDDHSRRMRDGIAASNGINHIPGLVLQSSFQKEREASDQFLSEIYPRLRGSTATTGSKSFSGRQDGIAAGASVSVARQTTGRKTLSLSPSR